MNSVSEYSIIYCSPDPIADERINIGVVVLTGDSARVRFVSSWDRVKRFAGDVPIGHVKDFAESLELTTMGVPTAPQYTPMFDPVSLSTGAMIREMVNSWSLTIQFTPLQPSLEEPHALLERLSDRFLKKQPKQARRARTKAQVIDTAIKSIRTEIAKSSLDLISRPITVQTHKTIAGKTIGSIPSDLSLVNGHLLGAAQAVSFQIGDVAETKAQRITSLLSLVDVRSLDSRVNVAMVVAPPLPGTSNFRVMHEEFESTRRDARSANVRLVTEDEVPEWAPDFVGASVRAIELTDS